MAEWETDDSVHPLKEPYAAWRRDTRPAVEDPTRSIIPVILKVKSVDARLGFNEIAELLKKEQKNEEENGAPARFFISGLDRPILRERLESTPTKPVPDSLFRRLLPVYVLETAFDTKDGESSVFPFESENCEPWFIGAAIPNAISGLPDRDSADSGSTREDSSALAIIDDSFAFLNTRFVVEDESDPPKRISRFSRLRFQEGERVLDGKLISGAVLNRALMHDLLNKPRDLSEAELYQEPIYQKNRGDFVALDFTSSEHQPLAFSASHGTAVADAALTAFDEHNADGHELDLLGITIPKSATQDTSGQSLGTYLLLAMWQAIAWADELGSASLVINFSYGFTVGPKDGSSSLNTRIAELLDDQNKNEIPTALMVPMGNSALSRTVMSEKLAPDSTTSVFWVVEPGDGTPNFLELYGDTDTLRVTLHPPRGSYDKVSVNLDGRHRGQVTRLVDKGKTLAAVTEWNLTSESQWQSFGFFALGPTWDYGKASAGLPPGHWRIEVVNTSKTDSASVFGMIQRDDAAGTYPTQGRQSYFDHKDLGKAEPATQQVGAGTFGGPITRDRTASVFAYIKSRFVYTVGAGSNENGDQINGPTKRSRYASFGPKLEGTMDPHMTELADRSDHFSGVFYAGTYSGTKVPLSGSSIACPQAAGKLAAKPGNIGRCIAY